MAEVIFQGIVQGQHNYHFSNQDKDMMVATIDLIFNNSSFRIEVKQPHGTSFEEDEGFELYVPFDSPLRQLNYTALSDKCEEYYRRIFGSTGSMIQIGEGCTNITMSNNIVQSSWRADIPLSSDNATTW